MLPELDKKLEEYIKNCIDSVINNNTKNEKEEGLTDYRDILNLIVNNKTGQIGILIDKELSKEYNKTILDVLIDNIKASTNLLEQQLKK